MSDGYFDEDALLEGKFDRHIFLRLVAYVRPHVRKAVVGLSLVALVTVLALAGPFVQRLIVDTLKNAGPEGEQTLRQTASPLAPALEFFNVDPTARTLFFGLASAFLIVGVLHSLLMYSQFYILQVLGQNVIYDIRMHLFRRVMKMPLWFFQKQPVGRLVTRIAFDIESLTELFAVGLVTVFLDLFLVVGIAVCLLATNARLGVYTLTVLPLLVLVTGSFRYFARKVYREVARRRSILNAYTAENLDGIREVQGFARQERVVEEYARHNEGLLRWNLSSMQVWALFQPVFPLLTAVMNAVVIAVGGRMVLGVDMTLGEWFQFLMLMTMFVDPLRDLAEKYNIMQTAMASADRVFKTMDNPADPAMATPRRPRVAVEGRVEFRDVHFSYDGETPVLEGVSFIAEPGRSVALVGHTGAGKTTIISLLQRFWDVRRGAVLLDGVPLTEWNPLDLRANFSVVHQDVFLFAGTVRENIALEDEFSAHEVELAARMVGAHDFILGLPGAYEAMVEEGGVTFSAGQRQLIGFARAVLRRPPVLILDEATSNIDTATEHLIQRALTRVTRGRTSLIIAHRLSTVQRCDLIVVLHKGRVAEMGTHQELLARDGRYRRLYELQFAGQEPAVERFSPGASAD